MIDVKSEITYLLVVDYLTRMAADQVISEKELVTLECRVIYRQEQDASSLPENIRKQFLFYRERRSHLLLWGNRRSIFDRSIAFSEKPVDVGSRIPESFLSWYHIISGQKRCP